MFKQFIQKILTHKKVAVFSHVRPDGDCIGSQIALCLWLEKNGIEAFAYNEDQAPANLQWLAEKFPINKPKSAKLENFDAFILVDGNALHRFGETAEMLQQYDKPLFMIDHHPDPDDIFEESISKTSASSTAELIYYLYAEHDPNQIDVSAAKAMFTGIVTDTGSFQFSSVSFQTMSAAADLLKRGNFTPNEIVERIYAEKPLNQLKLLSLALDTIQTYADGKLATIHVTADMMKNTGTTKYDTEGFVQYPLSVEGVQACVFLREDGNQIKLSLRSKSEIDVNVWAREFDGGGHKKAAGAKHSGPLQQAIEDVIRVGKKQL